MLTSITNNPLKSQWHNMKRGLLLFHVMVPCGECGFFLSDDLRIQAPFIYFYLQDISLSLSVNLSLNFSMTAVLFWGREYIKGFCMVDTDTTCIPFSRTSSQCFSLTAREASECYFFPCAQEEETRRTGSNRGPQRGEMVPQPSCEFLLPVLAASPSVCRVTGLASLICFQC